MWSFEWPELCMVQLMSPGPCLAWRAPESCKVPQVIAKYCITLARVPELSWPG